GRLRRPGVQHLRGGGTTRIVWLTVRLVGSGPGKGEWGADTGRSSRRFLVDRATFRHGRFPVRVRLVRQPCLSRWKWRGAPRRWLPTFKDVAPAIGRSWSPL